MGLLVLANGSGEGKPSWLWAAVVKLVTKSSLSVCTKGLPLGLTDGKINQLPSLTELGDNAGSRGTKSLYPPGAVGFLDVLLRGHHSWSPGPRSWGDPLATCETILLQCKRGSHAKDPRATGGPCISLLSQTYLQQEKPNRSHDHEERQEPACACTLWGEHHASCSTPVGRYPRQLKWVSSRTGTGQAQGRHRYPQGMSPLLRLLRALTGLRHSTRTAVRRAGRFDISA